MTTSPNIEKLFLDYLEKMGDSPGGFIGLLNPKNIEDGDPKTLGKEIKLGAKLLENRIVDFNFQPWELENGKTGARLKESIKTYYKMGEEIEQMTDIEPKEYHLYLIAILIDLVASLFNHIEIHIDESNSN